MQTTLLIMAAGIGSRFGTGIKQLEPVDDAGHIITRSIGVRPHKAVPDIKRALPWSKELPEQCRMK